MLTRRFCLLAFDLVDYRPDLTGMYHGAAARLQSTPDIAGEPFRNRSAV
jgi:hypothetical protein